MCKNFNSNVKMMEDTTDEVTVRPIGETMFKTVSYYFEIDRIYLANIVQVTIDENGDMDICIPDRKESFHREKEEHLFYDKDALDEYIRKFISEDYVKYTLDRVKQELGK